MTHKLSYLYFSEMGEKLLTDTCSLIKKLAYTRKYFSKNVQKENFNI